MAVKFWLRSNFERVLIPLLVVAATTAAATAAEDSLLLLPSKRADADRNKGDDDALVVPMLHFELISSVALLALLFRAVSVLAGAGAGPVVPPPAVVKPAYVEGIKSAAAASATTNTR